MAFAGRRHQELNVRGDSDDEPLAAVCIDRVLLAGKGPFRRMVEDGDGCTRHRIPRQVLHRHLHEARLGSAL